MAALPGFTEPDGAVGDVYNGYEIVEVINAGAGRYAWESITEFKSIADLSATAGLVNGRAFKTKGYYTAGDGGGQDLVYRSSGRSGITVDGGFYFTGPGADDYFEAVDKTVVIAERFGMVGDDSTNNATRFQAAINACAAANDSPGNDPSRVMVLGEGTYRIGATLTVKSGVRIVGQGNGTKIKKASSFSGSSAFNFYGGSSSAVVNVSFSQMRIEGAFAAFTDGSSSTGYASRLGLSTFRDIELDTTDGFILDHYCQTVDFENIVSQGSIERFFDIKGNGLSFRRIVQEGGTGTNSSPIFKVSDWTVDASTPYSGRALGIQIHDIIIEGNGHATKTTIVLEGVQNCGIHGLHVETVASDGYAVRLVNCDNVTFTSGTYHSGKKIRIEESQNIIFDCIDLATQTGFNKLDDAIEVVDTVSSVIVNNILSLKGRDVHRVTDMTKNITVRNVSIYDIRTFNPTGLLNLKMASWGGQNMLKNPSFESGAAEWQILASTGTPTATYGQSEVGTGLQLNCTVDPVNSSVNIYQSVTFATEHIGQPFTFCALAKVNSGTGWVQHIFSGAGISSYQDQYNGAYDNSGWVLISQTFIVQSAGAANVGISGVNVTDFSVDCCSLCPGVVAIPDMGSFQSIQLGGRTVVQGSAAPSSGTWKQGDIVINSEPANGEASGWQCVVAGTPGTWLTMAPIGMATSSGIIVRETGTTNETKIVGKNIGDATIWELGGYGPAAFRSLANGGKCTDLSNNLAAWECSDLYLNPNSSINPANNGQVVIEKTSNTSLTVKLKGSDGTVRSTVLTLS